MNCYRMSPERGITRLHTPINSKPPESGSVDHAYRQVAAAIVTQAILDWCHSYDRLKKCPNNKEAKKIKQSTEDFFNSSEPEYLCGIKGTDIYNKILTDKVYGNKEVEYVLNKKYVNYMPPDAHAS